MTKLHKFKTSPGFHGLILACLVVAVIAFFSLDSEQGWKKDYKLAKSPQIQEQAEPITSGVYGPFSSYYHPSLFFNDEECRLVENSEPSSYQVICLSLKSRLGIWLARTSETETIQATLAAVNDSDDKPVPELTIIFPLADMDQKFLTQNIMKRLLNVTSIFDAPCQLTYQIDGQSPVTEKWSCSSFLNHFDKYTGQPKLYYELRARPTALWHPAESVPAEMMVNRKWPSFFKNLQGQQNFNINLDLNGELIVESTLNLTPYDKTISKFLAVYDVDQSKLQHATNTIRANGTIFGPFDRWACDVYRYVSLAGYDDGKPLYQDIFLVDCNRQIPQKEDVPKWFYRVFESYYKKAEVSGANSELESNHIDLAFSIQDFDSETPSGHISISNFLGPLLPVTYLSYPLTHMDEDLFSSRAIQGTLSDGVQLGIPCTLSYKVDGELASSENLKCNLLRDISGGDISIQIWVDYGYDVKKYFQFADNTSLKAELIKATSFLKDIKRKPNEIVMEIKFGTGETITTNLDLANFDFALIDRLFKRIDALK